MQAVSIMLIVVAIVSAVCGAGPLSLWGKNPHSRSLSMLALTISFWSLSIAIFLSGSSRILVDFWVPAYYAAAGLIPLFGLAFALSYSARASEKKSANTTRIIACFAVFVIITAFCFWPDWLIESIDASNFTVELNQLAYGIYTAYFIVLFLIATAVFVKNMLRARRNSVRLGLKKVLVVWVVGGIIGSTFNLFLPLFGNYGLIWVGPPVIMLLMMPMSSSLVTTAEHFSLARTFARGVLYCVFGATVVVYAVIASYFVGKLAAGDLPNLEKYGLCVLILVLLIGLTAVMFRFTQRVVDKSNSDGYDENEVLSSMSQIVADKHEPTEFLKTVRHTLKRLFDVEQVDAIIFGHDTAAHILGSDIEITLLRLVSESKRRTIYREDVRSKRDLSVLTANNIEVITPIISTVSKNVIGVIVLSPRKRRYDRYYGETLERVSAIISPTIQTAAFYQQILEFNNKLRAEIAKKTEKLRESNKELRKLDEMKSDLLSIASHNLRTPLTSVIGFVDMILSGDAGRVNKNQREFLEMAAKAGRTMNQVVSSLLDSSRIDNGSFELNKTEFDLAETVDDEVSVLQENAKEKGVDLTYSRDDGEMMIDGDAPRIRQVIINLVENAMQYGGGKIEVELRRAGKRAIFTVKDYGIGIPEDEQAKVFDKMFRASNADRSRPDGTGIGLYVVKNTIEESGGKMIFESTEGRGSVFGFEI